MCGIVGYLGQSEAYPILIEALQRDAQPFAVIRAKAGQWTIGAASDGRWVPLSRGGDPVLAAVQTLGEIRSAWQSGSPLALCGLGDGYVLSALAHHSPVLPLGRHQAVFVIEPDPQLLLAVLLLHDLSGPSGPIQQGRFGWFVGPDWPTRFENELLADLFLPFPESHVCQSTQYAQMEAVFQQTLAKLLEADRQAAQQTAAFYDSSGMDSAALSQLFSDRPPRRPRVLLITSRFTTVLQYSTADAAEALAKLGWETRTVIEPSPHHALRKHAMRWALAEFQPDLVLLIDHLRHEYEDVFPPRLPFVCWIQDHLSNLTSKEAGASVAIRDFVLTAIGTHFVQQHGYPPRQIVDLPNLARIPARPQSWISDGLDLAYLSNWSRTTDQIVQEVLARASASPQLRSIAEAAVAQVLGVYERGGCLATSRQVRRAVEQAQLDCGIGICDAQLLDGLVNLLWDRLNNHLYRHQALCWVADLARQGGIRFGIYGRGWEDHPHFAPYARGVVQPGADLENLVRSTRINLQLEPFACFTHPRLLAGVFAGGFFLIRDHPFNHLPQMLLDFLSDHVGDDVQTLQQARSAIAPQHRAELEAILSRCDAMSEQADPVQMARNWQRAGLLRPRRPAVANLADVLFADPLTLRDKVHRFLADEPLRRKTAGAMRGDLESRLSYEAGLQRACRQIGHLLRTEPCA